MAKDPYMPFYVNDWLSSPRVACMSLEQQGAFVRLLCYCWASGTASIPADDATLARLSGMGEGWLPNGSHLVRGCFAPHPDGSGNLTNLKLFELWRERVEWREKSIAAGVKSGQSRRKPKDGKEIGSEPNANQTRTKREPNGQPNGNSSSSSSSSSKEEEVANRNGSLPALDVEKKTKNPPKVKADASTIPIPSKLDVPAFREVWASWLADRKERGKPMTARAAEMQFRKLLKLDPANAVACVEKSIAAGWSDVFEEKFLPGGSDYPRKASNPHPGYDPPATSQIAPPMVLNGKAGAA